MFWLFGDCVVFGAWCTLFCVLVLVVCWWLVLVVCCLCVDCCVLGWFLVFVVVCCVIVCALLFAVRMLLFGVWWLLR